MRQRCAESFFIISHCVRATVQRHRRETFHRITVTLFCLNSATNSSAAMRRFRVRLMSGDEAAFELDAAKCIRDLKRLIASERALGAPPVARQRLVLMPAHGGREPHEVLADGRTLAHCGQAAGDETELELVVVDAPVDVPVISEVRLPFFCGCAVVLVFCAEADFALLHACNFFIVSFLRGNVR